MMIAVAKTRLNMTMREFWLMTPKVFFEITDAWLRLEGKGKDKVIVLDEVPVGYGGL